MRVANEANNSLSFVRMMKLLTIKLKRISIGKLGIMKGRMGDRGEGKL